MIGWIDVALLLAIWIVGNVVFAPFARGVPWWKRALKLVVALAILVPVGLYVGRWAFYGLIAAFLLALLTIHLIVLRKRGIHWRTGEPLRPRP